MLPWGNASAETALWLSLSSAWTGRWKGTWHCPLWWKLSLPEVCLCVFLFVCFSLFPARCFSEAWTGGFDQIFKVNAGINVYFCLRCVEANPNEVVALLLEGVFRPSWKKVFELQRLLDPQLGLEVWRIACHCCRCSSDFSHSVCSSSWELHSGMPSWYFSFCHSSSFFLTRCCAGLMCDCGEMKARSPGQSLLLIPASFRHHSMILSLSISLSLSLYLSLWACRSSNLSCSVLHPVGGKCAGAF